MTEFGISTGCFSHGGYFSGPRPADCMLTLREHVVEAFVRCAKNRVFAVKLPADMVKRFSAADREFVLPELGVKCSPLCISPSSWRRLYKNRGRSSVLVYPDGRSLLVDRAWNMRVLHENAKFVVSVYSRKLPEGCFVLEARNTHLDVVAKVDPEYVISVPVSWDLCWVSRVEIKLRNVEININPDLARHCWNNRCTGVVEVDPRGAIRVKLNV